MQAARKAEGKPRLGYDVEDERAAFNELLRPHLGGDLFDLSKPGRMKRGPVRRFVKKLRRGCQRTAMIAVIAASRLAQIL